jgi:hypothetical protein
MLTPQVSVKTPSLGELIDLSSGELNTSSSGDLTEFLLRLANTPSLGELNASSSSELTDSLLSLANSLLPRVNTDHPPQVSSQTSFSGELTVSFLRGAQRFLLR